MCRLQLICGLLVLHKTSASHFGPIEFIPKSQYDTNESVHHTQTLVTGETDVLGTRGRPSSKNSGTLGCGTSTLLHGLTYNIVTRFNSGDYSNSGVSCKYRLRPAETTGALRVNCERLIPTGKCIGSFNITGIEPAGTYCKRLRPVVISLPETVLFFRTSDVGSADGFRCEVQSLTSGAGCGGNALPCGSRSLERGKEYTLLSKNFPGAYGQDLYCKWKLKAIVPTDTLTISCNAFHLESHKRCWRDWLAVEGAKASSSTACFSKDTPWCRYCGTTSPSLASVGQMSVEFVSDHQSTGGGFNCTVMVSNF